MKIANLFLSVSMSVALLGCGSKDGAAEKMVSMLEDLANAVEKAGDDCGKMADGVEAVSKKYDLKALKAEAEKLKNDPEASKKMMEKYSARMEKAMPKMMGMMKCADDPKMKAASEKLEGMM